MKTKQKTWQKPRLAAVNPLVRGQPVRSQIVTAGDMPHPYSIESLNRAIDVMSAFSHERAELSLNDIVVITGLPKTTVFRILMTLVERHLCEQDPASGTYSLGFATLHFAEVRKRQANIRDLSIPVMREIRDRLNETVVLSIRSGDYRVHVDSAEGFDPMRRMAEPGVRVPLYVGAASKVLLASMSDIEIDTYLSRTTLKPFQKNTLSTPIALRREIAIVRRNGYAESRSELIAGCAALAAPIRTFNGETVAVIDVLTPEVRYTPAFREACIRMLTKSAQMISERLGLMGDSHVRSKSRVVRRYV